MGRARAMLLALCALAFVSAAWAGPPTPATPSRAPPRDDPLPPPPIDDAGGDAGETDGGGGLTEEERQLRRVLEARRHVETGDAASEKGRFDEAIRAYSQALSLQPGDASALKGRAHARKAKSKAGRCPRRALADILLLSTYDPKGTWVCQRQVAMEWMADCGSDRAADRLALAKELANEDPDAQCRPDDIRVRVAELQYAAASEAKSAAEGEPLVEAALQQLERYREECVAQKTAPTAVALRLQAEIYGERKALDKAVAAYEDLVRVHPTAPESAQATKRIDDLKFEISLGELEKTQGWKPTPAAEAAYGAGVVALRRGDLAEAERQFSAAIADSRWFPQAYYFRGETFARTGRFRKAVDDLKIAIRMDRSDYQAHMTLGMIYKKEFAGAEDEQAIKHLGAALRLRPDLHQLHLLLGELYARSDRQRAREHYQAFVAAVASFDDEDAARARKALEDLNREIREEEPPDIDPPAQQSLRSLPMELQRMINEAYLRGTEHQDWAGSEKILLQARERFPNQPEVLNLLARVVYAQERSGDARQYWEQSLAMREDQMEVHERLGLLLREPLPDEAIPHLRRAADLGSVRGRFVLADLLWQQTQLWDASEQLDRYLEEASEFNLHYDRAIALRDHMDDVFLRLYLAAGAVLTIIVVVPAWRIYRVYRGASLGQLLERAPKSFPEVARILSLIRHEILKHNTSFLADVGRALEFDAQDAEARANMLSRRLFGEGSGRDPAGGPGGRGQRAGIHGRFLGYLDELQQVGRNHGVTLNLQRKDPIFRPMIRSFDELARRADQLRGLDNVGSGRKLELARVLGRAGHVLGRQAFERLSGLIRSLCVVHVEPNMVAEIYQEVAGEEQFAGRAVAPLEVGGEGAPIRVFRTDLEDILANVFRNSLRSSLSYAEPPVGLGIELALETDEITGLSTLAIRIKDRSPEQLSNEMLRGRYVERGMGITVDLLSRYDGSIAVEPEPGWQKSVVLRFFTLEEQDSEVLG